MKNKNPAPYVLIMKEGDMYVIHNTVLDIASQGCTLHEARLNLDEAVELWFMEASHEEVVRRFIRHGVFL